MNEIIKAENLTKCYGNIKAVDSLCLSIKKGEIYGFLGLNGAGKTTTIRILLGMVRPTYGTVCIFGEKVDGGNHELLHHIGSLVETPYSYPDLTVWENLEMIRKLRNITNANTTLEILSRLKLKSYRNRKAGVLSLGNAQRLGLAKALLHKPPLLILDEPTNGLDPAGIVEVRKMLLDLAKNYETTVFISSHILDEVSKLASCIGIIHQGRLIREVTVNELEHLRRKRLQLDTFDRESTITKLQQNGYIVNQSAEGWLEIEGNEASEHPGEINKMLVETGNIPTLLKVAKEDLETYFLRTIGTNGGKSHE